MANYFEWKPVERKADEPSAAQPAPEPPAPVAPAPRQAVTSPDVPDGDANLSEVDDEIRPMVGMVASMIASATDVDTEAEGLDVEGLVGPLNEVPDAQIDGGEVSAEVVVAPPPTRLDLLTAAIDRHPDAPVNYVLRGEALREAGDLVAAVEDFLMALRLAEGRETTWEFLNRAFLDRARQGLRRCGYTSAE